MDKNDVFKRYSICEKIEFEKYETYLVYDNLFERNKRLTFLTKDELKRTNISNLTSLYALFSNQSIKSMEYLFDWGKLSDKSYFFVRDARSLLKIKQHSFLVEDLKVLLLDILIALYNIHRNNAYYGKIHHNSIYYCFNRYDKIRQIHYVLSAISDSMKYNEEQLDLAQKWDLMSLGITILRLLSKEDIDILLYEENHADIFRNLSDHEIETEVKEIILDLIDSKYDALHYIKRILKCAYLEKSPQLKSIYDEFLFSMFPKRHIHIEGNEIISDPSKILHIIEGPEGSGKTELLNLQSQEHRKRGHSVLRIESLSATSNKIGIYNNIFNYIKSFFPNPDSATTGDHQLYYALSVMKDRVNPVLMVDDAEHAEPHLASLIQMFIQAQIPVFITQRPNSGDSNLYVIIKGYDTTRQICFIAKNWNKTQISELVKIAFPRFGKDVQEYLANKLKSYNLDKPKDIMRIIFQIQVTIGLDEHETGKLLRIITNIISKNLVRQTLYENLSEEQRDILMTLYLFPTEIKSLSEIVSADSRDAFRIIESLMREGYLIEKNSIFSVNKEIVSSNLALNEPKKYIQAIHKKISDFLIAEAKKTKKYSPLLIADHLYNSGEKKDSAPFFFNAALNYEKTYNFDQAIKYYNIALSVYKSHKKDKSKEKIRHIYHRLFDLFMKRGNLSSSLQCLKNLQSGSFEDFEYHKRYSIYYRKKGDYKKAITHINKASELVVKHKDKNDRLAIQTDLINILIEIGKFERAYKLINEALTFQKENGIPDGRGYLLNLRGVVYLQFGSYDKAENCLLEASEIEKNSKNYLVLPLIYNNLGIIYLERGNFPKALTYYNSSLEISLRVNDIVGISRGYHNIGILYKMSGELIEAENYFMKSKIYHERANLKYGYAKDLQQLGSLYTLKGDLNRAFSLLKESMRSSDRMYDKDSTSETLEYLGLLYFFLGSYQEALQSLMEAKEKALKTKNMHVIISVNMHLALIYLDLGDYETAVHHSKLALDEIKRVNSLRNMFINQAIIDICSKQNRIQKEGLSNIASLNLEISSIRIKEGNSYYDDIIQMIEKEITPISKFRMIKIYLDFLFSLARGDILSEAGKNQDSNTAEGEITLGIESMLSVMKDINIINNSRYYGLYYKFYDCLLKIDLKKENSFIANTLKKSVESLEICIDKDYSELIWRWEYLAALSYKMFNNKEKAREHFSNVLSRLENSRDNLADPYSHFYLKAPFREYIYNMSNVYITSI